jgi:hypothetical protein
MEIAVKDLRFPGCFTFTRKRQVSINPEVLTFLHGIP